jgi:hypothetical protein
MEPKNHLGKRKQDPQADESNKKSKIFSYFNSLLNKRKFDCIENESNKRTKNSTSESTALVLYNPKTNTNESTALVPYNPKTNTNESTALVPYVGKLKQDNYSGLLIMDDCLSHSSAERRKTIYDEYTNGYMWWDYWSFWPWYGGGLRYSN